jgi:hypothetical protein
MSADPTYFARPLVSPPGCSLRGRHLAQSLPVADAGAPFHRSRGRVVRLRVADHAHPARVHRARGARDPDPTAAPPVACGQIPLLALGVWCLDAIRFYADAPTALLAAALAQLADRPEGA